MMHCLPFKYTCLFVACYSARAFLSLPSFARSTFKYSSSPTVLQSGDGIAKDYRWHEEAFEIDVTVRVPVATRARDVYFKASARSIDLKLRQPQHNGTTTEHALLDATRTLRGRVNVDGTYWVISEPKTDNDERYREVTVTVEKIIRTPKDDFDVVEYDWRGVYADDSEEVSSREYDEPEKLDVREYAASLGVDIDNIDMSMVDKTMFSSGLNLTQKSLDELNKAGYLEEVTRQADGREYKDEDGQAVPFQPFGASVGDDEVHEATSRETESKKIPFLDTNSPWHNAVPVQVDKEANKTFVTQTRNFTRAAFAEESAKAEKEAAKVSIQKKMQDAASDPIDLLTVNRLKEILKSQGLKVTGTKKELQDRLRQRVNKLMQGQQDDS